MQRQSSRRLDGEAKRARQLGLASLLEEGLPITRLVRVVEKLKSHADLVAKPPSRKEFRNLQDRMFEELGEMETIDVGGGETWEFEFFSFGKVLNQCAATCPDFEGALQYLLLQCPPTLQRPWNLIVYWDEIVRGDPLRLDLLRKFEAVYMTIREFGPTLLKHERMWLPVAAVRTKMVDKVPGKWTEVLKVLLRRLLVGINGVFFGWHVPALATNLFFRLGNLLADGDGLRKGLAAMGASATLPCPNCWNVSNNGDVSIASASSDEIVDISCTDVTKLKAASYEHIWHRVDKLAELKPTVSDAALKAKETKYGFRCRPTGFLRAMDLRKLIKPSEVITHDGTHVFYANGLIHRELGFLIKRIEKCRPAVKMEELQTYLTTGWDSPRAVKHAKLMDSVFSTSRIKKFRNMKGKKNQCICIGGDEHHTAALSFFRKARGAKSGS